MTLSLFSITFLCILLHSLFKFGAATTLDSGNNEGQVTETRDQDRLLYAYEVWLGGKEVCRNGDQFGKCDVSKFPTCKDGTALCFHRKRRTDKFVHGNSDDPKYYIEYDRVLCQPTPDKGESFNCSSCTPGEWCPTLHRCTWKPYKYCPDDRRYDECHKSLCPAERKWLRREQRRKRMKEEDAKHRGGSV